MGGGGGDSRTTTVQRADPWRGQQPYLTDVFKQAQQQYYGLPTQYYPGQTYTPLNPLQQMGLRGQLEYGTGPAMGIIGPTQQAYRQMLTAPDITQNPYLQQMGDIYSRRVGEAFGRDIMPAIRGRAIQAGQLGSPRQALAEAKAAESAQQAIADATAQMYGQAYGQGLEQQARGMAFGPQALQMGMFPAQTMQQVGGALQAEQQRALQDDISRFYASMAMPREDLARYMATVQGQYGGTTTSSGQVPGAGPGGLGGAIGGGLMGASLAPTIGSGLAGLGIGGAAGPSALMAAGMANPLTMPLAIGGALLGGLF